MKNGTHWNHNKGRHPCPRIIRVLFDESWINHEYDAIDGDRGFSNIRSQHNFPSALWCRFEYLRLHLAWKISVNGADNELRNLVPECTSGLLKILMARLDFFLAL